MSDETKPATPAPAPAPCAIENPMASWVRGGTVSAAYEQQMAQQKAAAVESRRIEDSKRVAAENDPDHARQFKKVIGGNKEFPGIVLEVKHPKDNTVLDYIECELIVEDDGTLTLNMACWRCAYQRNISDNFKFNQKHKRWDLDTRKAGQLWVNPKNPQHIVTLAGTVFLHEVVTCPNLGCGMRFKIDNSVVREV